jgi:integrase
MDPAAPISLYSLNQHVMANDITKSIRSAAASTGLYSAGYTEDRISAHSLRATGAMALKLAGQDEATIKKLGRWSSTTWMKYIHAQIATLTAGLSEQMAVERVFVNVG